MVSLYRFNADNMLQYTFTLKVLQLLSFIDIHFITLNLMLGTVLIVDSVDKGFS